MEPTHERELTEPVDLCTPNGRSLNPAAVGWSRTPLQRANLRGRWGRTKRWDYWAVLAGDLAFGLVYADVDYLGLVSVWWGDLSTGRSGGRDAAIPFARGIRLPERSGEFPLVHTDKHLDLRIADFGPTPSGGVRSGSADAGPDGGAAGPGGAGGAGEDPAGTRLKAEWREKDGTEASLDVFISRPRGHESLNVVIPWSESTFQFTTKDQALPAVGRFRLGDAVTDFGERSAPDGGDTTVTGTPAWGVLDVGRGRWPYSTNWNWGGGAGHADTGELVGLQFGAKWTEGTGFTENGITVDGRMHKIGRELRWTYDWDRPMEPWRVEDPGGAIDLTLTPRFDKHSGTNLGALRTEVHQVFGTWSGTVVSDDGRRLTIHDAQGFAEESRNRW